MAQSISLTSPVWPCTSNQRRKRLSAAPSRRCACRDPSTSTAFFFARGSITGSADRTTFAPTLPSVLKNHADAIDGSTLTRLPFSVASCASTASSARSVTSLPRCATSSGATFFGLMNSSACPSANRNARPSGSGVRDTSPPRMLNSQASEAGEVITAASTFCSASILPSRARFAEDVSPAYFTSCGTTGRIGSVGRPCHAASIGLISVVTRVAPALAAASISRSSASGDISFGS